MKKRMLLLSCVFLFISTISLAQFRKVPADVTEAFKTKYPQASEVSWSDKITAFQASFQLNHEQMEADFSSKGVWKKTARNLDTAHLPEAIAKGFADSKYSTGWAMRSATETQKEDMSYEYRLLIEKSALQKKYLYFSKEGRLLREAITL